MEFCCIIWFDTLFEGTTCFVQNELQLYITSVVMRDDRKIISVKEMVVPFAIVRTKHSMCPGQQVLMTYSNQHGLVLPQRTGLNKIQCNMLPLCKRNYQCDSGTGSAGRAVHAYLNYAIFHRALAMQCILSNSVRTNQCVQCYRS